MTIFNQDYISYLINEDEKTASVVRFQYNYDSDRSAKLPRAVKFESKEYIIKSILKSSHARIGSLRFSPDSEIIKIEKEAFCYSTIHSIFIPASLIELEKGWCQYTQNLIKIDVDPKNPRYKCYDKKLIIGKSTIDQEEYDTLVFCVRNIVEINIPNFIKIIEPHAFEFCIKLQKIEFDQNSQLEIIERQSFCFTPIKIISIPPHCRKICEYAFIQCKKLSRIEIPTNSELQTIEKNAFYLSSIESIFIPENLTELKEGWNQGLYKLKRVEIDPKNQRYSFYQKMYIIGKSTPQQKNYDTLVFSVSNLSKAIIPKFIKFFDSYAFNCSTNLRKIIFESDSELQIIGKESFSSTAIEKISIPSHVKKICEGAFSCCKKLKKIEIPTNSELQTIKNNAFLFTSIEDLYIPASLIELDENWCNSTERLIHIDVDKKNQCYSCLEGKFIIGKSTKEQKNFDKLVFAIRNIIDATIPHFIKIIGSYAFDNCIIIRRIEFQSNSELREIRENSFSCSSIKKISIPPHVIKIGENAFYDCKKFSRIDIPENSELKIIEEKAFYESAIESISIPSQVTTICNLAFLDCSKFKIFEINENSEMQQLNRSSFANSRKELIILIPKKIKLID